MTGGGLLPRAADALARGSARFVPDAFSIACILTLLSFALALTVGGASPGQCVEAWGKGFWELLAFSMQIVVVIFAGYVVAVAPVVRRLLDALAAVPRSPRQAVGWTALLSLVLCWLNWGVGLIGSAMLVRFVARRHPGADYRLLVAVAYLGLGMTWHAGPSGSVPLLMATPDNFMIKGGLLEGVIPLRATILTPFNLSLMALVVVGFSAFVVLLHPPPSRVVTADPKALAALGALSAPRRPDPPTPADRIMHSPLLNRFVGGLGLAYSVLETVGGRLSLTLDSVNLLFLCLGIFLHPSPQSLLRAAEEASSSLHGVVLQFPIYAGIYGIMKGTGLAELFAQAFLDLARPAPVVYPLMVFWYSAVLDYFVPSGGGKWAIEAVYVLQAGKQLGFGAPAVAMAYAYGDMAANLIQPFWAIPLLGVARLEFREILGYELVIFLVYAALMSVALLASAAFSLA